MLLIFGFNRAKVRPFSYINNQSLIHKGNKKPSLKKSKTVLNMFLLLITGC